MKVKLLRDVVEKDKDGNVVGLKVTRRRNRNWAPPKIIRDPKGQTVTVEESKEQEFNHVPFTMGAVIEMSDESGKKYVEAGIAKEFKEPA